ncbi:MAG: glucuronate isomerase [Dictyoglomus thermophilum]
MIFFVMVDERNLKEKINKTLEKIKIIDIHTHLFPPYFKDLFLYGIDYLLTYHYLIAETIRYLSISPDDFYNLSLKDQAELVWKTLFVDRSPISESARGIVTILTEVEVDFEKKDLSAIRAYFEKVDVESYVDLIFEKAKIDYVVMTNDPLDEKEMQYWKCNVFKDKRFRPSLRLDRLINDWENIREYLKVKDYKEIKDHLDKWFLMIEPLYIALSFPPDFRYPDDTLRSRLLEEIILYSEERKVPIALMIGAKRSVNPSLRLAGDSVGKSNIESIENLCRSFPNNKFMVTMLSRENQHELCVTARKFKNLMIFGCWWFLNTPSLIEEITKMRLELLGFSFIPQHSDARVLEQLIYKWKHSKEIIKKVLYDKYLALIRSGWTLKEEDIERDITQLFRKNFEDFIFSKQ